MKYTVIGASAAGIAAVKAIIKQDANAEVTVISKDDRIYSRMMMYKVLAGELALAQSAFEKEALLTEGQVRWLRGVEVTGGDTKAKTLALSDGSTVCYDKLLLATGAVPFVPPVPGLREADNAFCFRDLPDLEKLKLFARAGNRAVIIGGGLVGLDVAYGLCAQGVKVDLVEISDRLLPLQLDAESAEVYQKMFKQAGVNFHLGRKAERVELSGSWGDAVVLDDGTKLPCAFIVVSSGVRPNLAIAQALGLSGERAIDVNDRMETSAPDVYAAGDVIGRSGIWQSAAEQGAVAGENMAGGDACYKVSPIGKNIFFYYGRMCASIGDVSAPDTTQIYRENGKNSVRLFLHDGTVKAVILMGDIRKMDSWFDRIAKQEVCDWENADLFSL